jgi:hypothetical protein
LPTFAQQKESIPNEQDRQWLDTLVKKFDEAWNNNDAAALDVQDAIIDGEIVAPDEKGSQTSFD